MAKEQIPYTRPYERERFPGEIYRDEGEETYRKNRRKGKALEEFKKEAKAAMAELFKKDNEDVDLGHDKIDANEAFKSQEVGKNPASVAKPAIAVTEHTDEEKERMREEEQAAKEADETTDLEEEEKKRNETLEVSYPGAAHEEMGEENKETTVDTKDNEGPPPLLLTESDEKHDESKRSDNDNGVSGPPFPV